uniref:Putative secreted salivary protein n=1 Tax=Rhipicephalus pulchellus TaxID=72859 RepID=L7M0B9_RHIPC
MNNLTACFIIFTLFHIRYYWQPSSNALVEAGRVISGPKDCWRYDCCPGGCPVHCRCPSPFARLFGVNNCR